MIRTQIQLSEEQYKRLRKTGDKSIAHQIREAIDFYFQKQDGVQIKSIREIAGKYRPISMEDLKDHDRWMAETVLHSKTGKTRL